MNSRCSICGGAGFLRRDVPVNDPEFGKAVPCECKNQETVEATKRMVAYWRKWSGLDRIDWALDVGFPVDPQAAAEMRRAVKDQSGIWVFHSTFGTGKTGLLVGAVNRFLDKDVPAVYASVPRLLDALRASYRDNTFDDLFTSLIEIPVLALDEFHRFYDKGDGSSGAGSGSWASEKIGILIDERYMQWRDRLTLVATNLPPEQWRMNAITSRFNDSLVSHIVHVGGADLRPLNAELNYANGFNR